MAAGLAATALKTSEREGFLSAAAARGGAAAAWRGDDGTFRRSSPTTRRGPADRAAGEGERCRRCQTPEPKALAVPALPVAAQPLRPDGVGAERQLDRVQLWRDSEHDAIAGRKRIGEEGSDALFAYVFGDPCEPRRLRVFVLGRPGADREGGCHAGRRPALPVGDAARAEECDVEGIVMSVGAGNSSAELAPSFHS